MMEFKKIGIVGTGLMGGGIAQVCAQVGYETISYDVNEAAFDRTKGLIQASMDKMVAKGKFTAEYVEEVLGSLVCQECQEAHLLTLDLHMCPHSILLNDVPLSLEQKHSHRT